MNCSVVTVEENVQVLLIQILIKESDADDAG